VGKTHFIMRLLATVREAEEQVNAISRIEENGYFISVSTYRTL
jgi:hypothetical protein